MRGSGGKQTHPASLPQFFSDDITGTDPGICQGGAGCVINFGQAHIF